MIILDCNNFWSPSGGGVRRYHLQKLEFYKKNKTDLYYFLMNSDCDKIEQLNSNVRIRHIKAVKAPGNWEYRLQFNVFRLRKALKEIQPDVIEIGSPYIHPWMIPLALIGLKKPVLFGYWHADFPVTYVNRGVSYIHPFLGKLAEKAAWVYARNSFGKFHEIFTGSQKVIEYMNMNKIKNTLWVPLGVDYDMFNPSKKDKTLARKLKDGKSDRLTIFFPHRFCEEKGVRTLIKAYPLICERLGYEPALVFCGTGPDLDKVKNLAKKYNHVQYLGFLAGRDEMARYYASCDMGLALSGWETFGLTILEALASGQLLVGANERAAAEHVTLSGAGVTISPGNPEALADAITGVWLNGNHAKMKKAARKYAENFSWEQCFKLELNEYRKAVKK